jgi:Tol biopolymer transport system component
MASRSDHRRETPDVDRTDRAYRRPVKRTLLSLLLLALAAIAFSSAQAGAATLAADTTEILSGNSSLLAPLPAPVAPFSSGGQQSVSQDGRFVAFLSASDNLSAEDNDSIANVYVKDRATGAVTLVDRRTGAAGAVADQQCSDPAISDSGRRVAFTCNGPLDDADTNGKPDVYMRDLATNETFLVSRATNLGTVGNGQSETPAISDSGTRIAFASEATNLGGPTDSSEQIYTREIPLPGQTSTNPVTFVSRGDGILGNLPNDTSSDPSISDDGDKVAFQSSASNLVADDDNGSSDIFVRQISAATTRLASRADGAKGAPGNGDSVDPSISGDGGQVVFTSEATNLVPTLDTQTDQDVYERSLTLNSIGLVDQVGGAKANGEALSPSTNDDGTVIAFASSATNLDPADTDPTIDEYVTGPGFMSLASRAEGAAGAAANSFAFALAFTSISGDGKHVLFTGGPITADAAENTGGVSMRDLATSSTTLVSRPPGSAPLVNAGGFADEAVISADGHFAAFLTGAPALGGSPDSQIVVRDTHTGATTIASRADGANGAPLSTGVDSPSISADGRRVAFTSGDAVLVRDLASGSTILASRANGAAGAAANGRSFAPSISADGTRVAFLSAATNLGDGDTDATEDVHVRDLAAGTTVLADRANGAAGAKANGVVRGASLSADGDHVAFSSSATNLGDGDTDATTDVHVRDLAKGTTVLASVSSAGTKGNDNSLDPSISADGTRVAFDSRAANLDPTPRPANSTQVFVRDLAASKTILASRVDGPTGAAGKGTSQSPGLSADGHFVAFASDSNLVTGEGLQTDATEVYRRDLTTGSTQLVSRGQGPNGVAESSDARFDGGISATGACVAFRAGGDLLGPAPGASDYSQTFVRVFKADCDPAAVRASGLGGRDATAPLLRSVSLTRRRFRVAKASTPLAASAKARRNAVGRGTVLRFKSSEAGKLTVLIERVRPGRKSGKGRKRVCKPVKQRPRHGACTAHSRVGTLTRTVKAGSGRLSLSGKIGRRRLAPGSYRLTVRERDAAGNLSKPVVRSFTIVAG